MSAAAARSEKRVVDVAPALDQVREFLKAACRAEELDERLETPAAPPCMQATVEALNTFLDKLRSQSFELSVKQEMLERVVEIRTNEVNEILDNVDTGFAHLVRRIDFGQLLAF